MMQAVGCLEAGGVSADAAKIKAAIDAIKQMADGYDELVPDWDPFSRPPKFKVPAMDFPDNMSTEDIIGSITDSIAAMLVEILTQAFVEMIKGVLEGLILECDAGPNDKNNFGAENLNDGLKGSPDQQDALLAALDVPFLNANKLDGGPSPTLVDSEGSVDNDSKNSSPFISVQ